MKNEYKQLASLAVFRELYKNDTDVFQVVADLLSNLIKTERIIIEDLTSLTRKFNEYYEFEIPSAVINTSLKRLNFQSLSNGKYTFDLSQIAIDINIDQRSNEIENVNKEIVEKLFKFIENEKNRKLEENEKREVTHSFCTFLMDENNGNTFSDYISAFIIKNEYSPNFINQISIIREGVILYSGLKFNTDINKIGWSQEFTVYLETEIIFHFAGYNGEVYKNSMKDFISFVNEINRKSKKKLISLKYFKESKDEIEQFFTKAESIIDNKEPINPKITAMTTIINGCKSKSDILEKKADLYLLLNHQGIEKEAKVDFYEEHNRTNNIIGSELFSELQSNFPDENINESITLLNYINILRGGNNSNNFENARYILLSGKRRTISLSWNEKINEENHIPLATNLNHFISVLWFKLNRSFGNNSFPKTFDVITKSQIVLSTKTNECVGKKYEELKSNKNSNNITPEIAASRINQLRQETKKPEDISNSTALESLHFINEDDLEKHINEQSLFKQKSIDTEIENIALKQEIEKLTKINHLATSEKNLRMLEVELSKLITQKKSAEDNNRKIKIYTEKKSKTNKIICSIAAALLVILFIIITIKYLPQTTNNEYLKKIQEYKVIMTFLIAAIYLSIHFIAQIFYKEKLEVFVFTNKLNKKLSELAENKGVKLLGKIECTSNIDIKISDLNLKIENLKSDISHQRYILNYNHDEK